MFCFILTKYCSKTQTRAEWATGLDNIGSFIACCQNSQGQPPPSLPERNSSSNLQSIICRRPSVVIRVKVSPHGWHGSHPQGILCNRLVDYEYRQKVPFMIHHKNGIGVKLKGHFHLCDYKTYYKTCQSQRIELENEEALRSPARIFPSCSIHSLIRVLGQDWSRFTVKPSTGSNIVSYLSVCVPNLFIPEQDGLLISWMNLCVFTPAVSLELHLLLSEWRHIWLFVIVYLQPERRYPDNSISFWPWTLYMCMLFILVYLLEKKKTLKYYRELLYKVLCCTFS